jgi:uncharacterized protein (UPF0548 family)
MKASLRHSLKGLLTTATLTWFDNGCCDVKYLDEWHDAPLNYYTGQVTTPDWHIDHHEKIIAQDSHGRLFQHAADLLMHYQFYPPHILTHVSTFSLADRWLEVGDRIVQRIHLLGLFGRSILDVVTMTEITQTIVEPHRCGFTYATVAKHVEQGEWSIAVNWRPNGDIVFTLDAVSRPIPQEPSRNYLFLRAFQKAAHLQGINHFQQMVTAVSA